MTNANRNQGDRLNDYLDDLEAKRSTSSGDLDSDTMEAVRRLNARDDAPPPPRDLEKQIWEELMNQAAIAGSIPLRPSIVTLPGLNGRTQSPPRRMQTAEPHYLRFPGYARFAAAFLLIVAIGAGYLAFDPFGGGSDRPSSIPAAIAPAGTPEILASPTPSFIARDSHLIIGTWMLDVDADENPGSILLPVTFNGDGTLVMYEASTGISIGTWHPTGKRTAELVWATQGVLSKQDLTDATITPDGATLDATRMGVWRVTVTIDESGKTMTSFGTYDAFQDGVSVFREKPWQMKWTRMIVDPTAVFPTPTP